MPKAEAICFSRRYDHLKSAVALALRTPAAFVFLQKKLRKAGPDASREELEKLGVLRANPLTLLNALRRAVRQQDISMARAAQNALWRHPTGLSPSRTDYVSLMPRHAFSSSGPTMYRFLFVSGVPRSGTTAMGNLLGLHRNVAMYIELYPPGYGYRPEMFLYQNVLTLSNAAILRLSAKNASVLNKSAACKIVGDKRPNFLYSAELTLPNFATSQLKVVHVVRNIYDIATSYQKGHEAGVNWMQDFRAAVGAANYNNRVALSLLTGPYKDVFVMVDYDRFWYSTQNMRALFRYLDVDDTCVGEVTLQQLVNTAMRKRANRQRCLTARQQTYVDRHYDMASEQELRSLVPPQLVR